MEVGIRASTSESQSEFRLSAERGAIHIASRPDQYDSRARARTSNRADLI